MTSADSTGETPHAYARLRNAMAPDPSRWYYTGTVNDTGEYGESHCACGHEVRYEFIIACEDDDRTLIIGSTCIETNVPALIRDGAGRLATQLDEARRKLQRDLKGKRRDLQAEEILAELHSDFRRLRNWCFDRRKEWQTDGQHREMPKVLHWIEQLPDDDEGPARYATAIRRRYVSMWLKSAQVLSTNEALYADAPQLPLPAQPQLFTQLANKIDRTAKNWNASNHQGAVQAIRNHQALQEVLEPEQTEVAGKETSSTNASSEDSPRPGAPAPATDNTQDCQPLELSVEREVLAADPGRTEPAMLLTEVDELDLPGPAKSALAEMLQRNGNTDRVCAIEDLDDRDGAKWVVLHLCTAEIDRQERWRNAELMRDALSLAWSSTAIHIARKAEAQAPSYHSWQEYCRRYRDPPDYLAGLWNEDDDEATQPDHDTPASPTVTRLVSWLRKRRAARESVSR